MIAACLALSAAACAGMDGHDMPMHDAAELAEAESSFAAHSVREGMRPAFLHWLAPGATLFRGGPVDGVSTITARPDPPIVLDWRPVYVETAASGEIGLSTGPWRLRAKKESRPESFGQFVSVWRRNAAGEWRVHVDLGIGHPGPSLWDSPLSLNAASPPPEACGGTLDAAESAFAETSRSASARAAYAASASERIRGYREGTAPFVGRDAFLESVAAPLEALDWKSTRAETSLAGDFGFTLGAYAGPAGAPAGHFLRVWRCEIQGWRIALDITEALPRR